MKYREEPSGPGTETLKSGTVDPKFKLLLASLISRLSGIETVSSVPRKLAGATEYRRKSQQENVIHCI
jgi:hypothetical protein